MPIRYAIQPDLDLLLYVFNGECTARDYFKIYHSVYLDELRHHGMKVLVDLSYATLDFDIQGMIEAKAIIEENKQAGFPPDHVALLTRGTSLRHLKAAFLSLTDNLPMYLEVFHTYHDAVRWLGLAEVETEAIHFWETCVQNKTH